MFVEDALGIAVCSAGVAEAAGIALVSLVPEVVAILGLEPAVELVVEADIMGY